MTKPSAAQQKRSKDAWAAWAKSHTASDLRAWREELRREGLNQSSIDMTVLSHRIRLDMRKDG